MRQKGAAPEDIRIQAKNLREKGRTAMMAILNEEQRKKYAQVLKGGSGDSAQKGRAWVVGEGGRPLAVQVTTGISDGSFTEIVSGDLAAGQEVIVGMDRSSASPAAKKRIAF